MTWEEGPSLLLTPDSVLLYSSGSVLFCKGAPGELTVGAGRRRGRRGRRGRREWRGSGGGGVVGTMHMLDATISDVFKIGGMKVQSPK